MNELEVAWLAGLLEGEGSFMRGPPSRLNQPRIALSMTDEDVVRRVAGFFGSTYLHVRKYREATNGWKPAFTTILRGRRAMAMMKVLHPMMGVRRQEQIARALASYEYHKPGQNSRKLSDDQVGELRRDLALMSVSAVSRKFDVSRTHVRGIRDGRKRRVA